MSVRVLPSLSRPLDLTPAEIERIAAHLSARLAGWGVPDRLFSAFQAATSNRLAEVLQDLEEERAADLSAYLSSGLHDGRLKLPPGIDHDHGHGHQDPQDQDLLDRLESQPAYYHPRVNPAPDPLHLATDADRPARPFRMPSNWHHAQARAIGHGLRDRSVLPFDRREEEGGGKPK